MVRYPIDERRDLEVAGDEAATIHFAITHFIACAQRAIADRGLFAVALSGGSTPRKIFEGLASEEHRHKVDWQRTVLFWSDERCVPPDDPESNYRMAMEAGLGKLSIPPTQIHRMNGDAADLNKAAEEYEKQLLSTVPSGQLDLVMLGMGDDGHTASLFPHTAALDITDKLVTPNFITAKNCWRLTLTFRGIAASKQIALYVIGKSKAAMLYKVLCGPYRPEELPAQRVGSTAAKALWIADTEAAHLCSSTTTTEPTESTEKG